MVRASDWMAATLSRSCQGLKCPENGVNRTFVGPRRMSLIHPSTGAANAEVCVAWKSAPPRARSLRTEVHGQDASTTASSDPRWRRVAHRCPARDRALWRHRTGGRISRWRPRPLGWGRAGAERTLGTAVRRDRSGVRRRDRSGSGDRSGGGRFARGTGPASGFTQSEGAGPGQGSGQNAAPGQDQGAAPQPSTPAFVPARNNPAAVEPTRSNLGTGEGAGGGPGFGLGRRHHFGNPSDGNGSGTERRRHPAPPVRRAGPRRPARLLRDGLRRIGEVLGGDHPLLPHDGDDEPGQLPHPVGRDPDPDDPDPGDHDANADADHSDGDRAHPDPIHDADHGPDAPRSTPTSPTPNPILTITGIPGLLGAPTVQQSSSNAGSSVRRPPSVLAGFTPPALLSGAGQALGATSGAAAPAAAGPTSGAGTGAVAVPSAGASAAAAALAGQNGFTATNGTRERTAQVPVERATVIQRIEQVVPGAVWAGLGGALLLALLATAVAAVAGVRARRHAGQFSELQAAALTDALTGLLNRRGFTEAAERELARARRYGRSFALAYVDVRGSQAGQRHRGPPRRRRAAQGGGRAPHRVSPGRDAVGRLGGDEMGILLAEQDDRGAEAVRQRIAAQVALRRAEIGVSAWWGLTVGVASLPRGRPDRRGAPRSGRPPSLRTARDRPPVAGRSRAQPRASASLS